jgi:hemin uptake protein HemP
MNTLNDRTSPPCLLQIEREGIGLESQSSGKINSADLLGRWNQLIIQHQGERYILRKTRAGKLILTK